MNPSKDRTRSTRRGRLALVAGVGAAALVAMATIGSGIAGAAPSQGAPHFNTDAASEQIRGSGSDTTFFMMQKISDIYTGAGLYGCSLVSAAGQTLIDGTTSSASGLNAQCQGGAADVSTTDDADNWNRVEVSEGTNSVGSGAGQQQLCGSLATPDPVNFARSSKPSSGISGCNEEELGYAKDGVPIVDFPTINPSTYGTSSFSSSQVAGTAYPAGAYNTINGGAVGPVAAGWLPGDNPAGTANKGTKLTQITNTGAKDTSVAFRMWCVSNTSPNAITDWGQLTNLGPNLEVNVDATSGSSSVSIDPSSGTTFSSTITSGNAVTDPFATLGATPFTGSTTVSSNGGSTLTLSSAATATGTFTLTFATGASKLALGSGVPIGIPIRLMGVNTSSGTEFTFAQFAQGATPDTSGCPDGSGAIGMNTNSGNDPNTATAPSKNPYHSALENNAHQLELFSQSDFPSDTVDQAIEEATTLYFMSAGVYGTNPYAAETTLNSTNYAANLIAENGVFSGASTELNNTYPTARTLSNIVNAASVTQSTAGFMNWICDSNTNFSKGTDLSTGTNYDAEVSNIISTAYGFPRLTDLSLPVSTSPADNTVAPNDDCVSKIQVVANGSTTVTYASGQPNPPVGQSGTNFPTSVLPASSYSSGAQANGAGTVTGTGIPSGTTVTSAGGSSTITLSNSIPAGTYVLEFFGVPGVTTASATP